MSKITIILIICFLIFGGMIFYILKVKVQSNKDEMFISTQSQSLERVKNLNLDKSLEEANILDINKLSFPKRKLQEKEEYKANSEREWIIDLIQVNGDNFKKEDFSKMFDYEWRRNFQSTLFGFSPEEKRWTYADAGNAPDIYSKLQIAVNLQQVYIEQQNYSPDKLQRYLSELERRIKEYPTPLKIEVNESIEEAISKAKNLISLQIDFSREHLILYSIIQSKILNSSLSMLLLMKNSMLLRKP